MLNLKVRHAGVESGVMVVGAHFNAALQIGFVFVDVDNERVWNGGAKAECGVGSVGLAAG